MQTAAIYTRISRDDKGQELGVRRQEEDCRKLASELGYRVGQVFTDNDRGASVLSKKTRPAYAEMIERIQAGEFQAVLAYASSRLTRRPRESEVLLDLVKDRGLEIKTVVSGSYDLSSAQGRAVARTLAAWDAAEAEQTGERIRRSIAQKAASGAPHGPTKYGWKRVDGDDLPDEVQSEVIRDAAARVLRGESLRSIATGLNARGIPTPRGAKWSGPLVKQLLVRQSNAGRVVHQGEVLDGIQGTWEPLMDADTLDRLRGTLLNTSRLASKSRGSDLKHLLSGILRCGLCDGPCRSLKGGVRADGSVRRTYVCTSCHKVRRSQEPVDKQVTATVLARLRRSDAPALWAGDPEAWKKAQARVLVLTEQQAEMGEAYAKGIFKVAQVEKANLQFDKDLAEARQQMQHAAGSPELAEIGAAVDPATAWEKATVRSKQWVIQALMEVRLMPTTPGRNRYNPEDLHITWKS